MDVSVNDVLAAGYRESPIYSYSLGHRADRFFQRRVRSGRTTLYFVNLWFYDRNGREGHLHNGWMAEVRFNISRDVYFDVEFHSLNESGVVGMEAFFRKLFSAMECLSEEALDEAAETPPQTPDRPNPPANPHGTEPTVPAAGLSVGSELVDETGRAQGEARGDAGKD